MTNVVLVGGGEHARVLVDAIRSNPHLYLLGFVDPNECAAMQALGVRRLGDDSALDRHLSNACVLGVGVQPGARTRQGIVGRSQVIHWAPVVHARAVVSPNVTIGAGAVIMAGAIVNAGVKLGAHSIVNSGAIVEHDVEVGDFTHVGPGCAIGGGAKLGSHSYLGIGSRIRDHVTIGDSVIVGMGAVVICSIPSSAFVVGVPARQRQGGLTPRQVWLLDLEKQQGRKA